MNTMNTPRPRGILIEHCCTTCTCYFNERQCSQFIQQFPALLPRRALLSFPRACAAPPPHNGSHAVGPCCHDNETLAHTRTPSPGYSAVRLHATHNKSIRHANAIIYGLPNVGVKHRPAYFSVATVHHNSLRPGTTFRPWSGSTGYTSVH